MEYLSTVYFSMKRYPEAIQWSERCRDIRVRLFGLNHLAIRVTNVERSRDFYQKLLGLPVIHEGQDNCFLGLGKNFLTLFRNQNPGLDHYCIAIPKFSADSVMETLKQQGLNPRRPSGSDRVYFPDPDGIEVQLSSVDHHA